MNDFQRTVAVRLGVAIAVVVVVLVLAFQAFAQTPLHPVDTHEVAQPAAPPTLGEQLDAEAAKLREKLDRVAAAGETATEMGEAAGTAIALLREDVSTKITDLRNEYRQLQIGVMAFLQEAGEDRKQIAELGDRADKLAAINEAMRIAIQSHTEQLANLRAELAAQHTPTAAELSQPGALQEYVDACVAATGRCRLPKGRIFISEANPLAIRFLQGASIIGSGMAYTAHDQKSGWNIEDNDQSTRLISTDGTGIVFGPCVSTRLQGFSVEGAKIGITYPYHSGYGSAFNLLDHVSFVGCEVGFQAGASEYNPNCADIVFRGCIFRDNGRGIVLKNNQAVNYLIEGLCMFQRNKVGIDLEHGGRLRVRDVMAYGGDVFIRTGRTSSGQLLVSGVSWDRKPDTGGDGWSDPLPILFDGRKTLHGAMHVEFEDVSVNGRQWNVDGKWRREGDQGDHHFYYMPKYAKDRSWQHGEFEQVHGYVDKSCSEVVYE